MRARCARPLCTLTSRSLMIPLSAWVRLVWLWVAPRCYLDFLQGGLFSPRVTAHTMTHLTTHMSR
jgi:hypothetical protein